MTVLRGVTSLDAALVHHTGSMIRFTQRQLQHLPAGHMTLAVLLPDGTEVAGRLHPHPRNPYIGGSGVVRWIKSWVPVATTVPIEVIQVGTSNALRVVLPGEKTSAAASGTVSRSMRSMAALPSQRRRVSYTRWERSPALRRIVLDTWAPECQVDGCGTATGLEPHLARRLVDVHHLNSVSKGGADSPANLCVLCVMHHVLIHRSPDSGLESWDAKVAVVRVNGITLRIERDAFQLLGRLG